MSVLLQAGEQELETLSFEHHLPHGHMLHKCWIIIRSYLIEEPKFNNVLCI